MDEKTDFGSAGFGVLAVWGAEKKDGVAVAADVEAGVNVRLGVWEAFSGPDAWGKEKGEVARGVERAG
jgi:hypothetical protein